MVKSHMYTSQFASLIYYVLHAHITSAYSYMHIHMHIHILNHSHTHAYTPIPKYPPYIVYTVVRKRYQPISHPYTSIRNATTMIWTARTHIAAEISSRILESDARKARSSILLSYARVWRTLVSRRSELAIALCNECAASSPVCEGCSLEP